MATNFLLLLFLIAPVILFQQAKGFVRRTRTIESLPRRTLILGNVFVLLFLLSVLILTGEIYFRFIYDSTDSFGLCKTTKEWFTRHFQRNRTGFRDSINYMPTVEPGRRRVSFVGDSFTIGHGIPDVEDRFANHVRRLRSEYEIHVLAECGWDTDRHLEIVEFLPKSGYEIDVVVLVYCLNDIADITPEWQVIVDRIYDAPEPGFLAENSYLFNTLHARLRMAQEPEIAGYYNFVRDAYSGPVWNEQKGRLVKIREAVEKNSGQLMVVTFPFLHAIGDDYSYHDIHMSLSDFWAEQNVPHLDLLDIYASRRAADLTISSRDAHPDESAHEMAANAIAEFIDRSIKDRSARKTELTGPQQSD